MNIPETFHPEWSTSPLRNALPISEWSEVQKMRLETWLVFFGPMPAAWMTDADARAILGVKRLPSPKRKALEILADPEGNNPKSQTAKQRNESK
ncbi:hypothetical protein [Subtercola endophyticus]|uniref:hypothetical protein n=1 Tax=Subtercola endophyticus TaxID=2895559 RepID=UPI001E542227|nr:hypothetical protein [Subtercola endophyticus]UFS58920.1 hypothetical protein LQ955_18315 [Subtercola endophyticus]